MFKECYKGYSNTDEDKTACFKPGWKPVDNSTSNDELPRLCPKPWRYQSAKETDTVAKWGRLSFYHGEGFIADLGNDNQAGHRIITNLKKSCWLDKQTRVVVAEFSSFNPSVNILGVATYFYEVEASGFKVASTQIDVISRDSSDTASLQFYSICLFLFILLVILHFGREIFRIYSHRSRYFQSVWHWVEMLQVVFSVLAVVIYLIRQRRVNTATGKLQENIDANISFQEAIIWQEADNAALGVLIFIVTVKLLRIIRLNSQVVVFSKALKISARSLSSFSIVLLTFFIAFLHFGVLMFGTGFERYSSVLKATYFQLELTLGRVKARPINELSETHNIYAKIFSFLILSTLTIVCMNFFIGMINDALLEAKNTAGQSVLHELVNKDPCISSKDRKAFFDVISHKLRQSKASRTLDEMEKSEMMVLREIKAEKQPSNVERKSFFDKTSRMLKAIRSINYNEQSKGKGRKNVRFQEDVVDSFLRKLDKKKNDLFQHLDRVITGFSEEEEDIYHLLSYVEGSLEPR